MDSVVSDGVAVASDVAVLAAGDKNDRFDVADVAHAAVSARVDAGETSRAEAMDAAVAEADLDLTGVDEVQLLLVVVEVKIGTRIPGGTTIALTPNASTPRAERTLRKPGPSPSSSRLLRAYP